MEDNQDRENDIKKTPHDQYTEAYIGILNEYRQHLRESTKKKNELKEEFFKRIMFIILAMTIIFGITVILSIFLMIIMARFNNNSIKIIAGSIVSLISSFITMIISIYRLPKIIAEYLFNKKEDVQMKEIITNIQKYEIDADKSENEKIRERANLDAMGQVMETTQTADNKMENKEYFDPSKEMEKEKSS